MVAGGSNFLGPDEMNLCVCFIRPEVFQAVSNLLTLN